MAVISGINRGGRGMQLLSALSVVTSRGPDRVLARRVSAASRFPRSALVLQPRS